MKYFDCQDDWLDVKEELTGRFKSQRDEDSAQFGRSSYKRAFNEQETTSNEEILHVYLERQKATQRRRLYEKSKTRN
ncbi:hypothetical protein GW915_08705 [bacterium]|nr:hypothetical protein [bacterium]